MTSRASYLIGAILLAMPLTARAQSVDEILARHFEAQGGLDKLKAVTSMRVSGHMTIGQGMEATFVRTGKRPNMSRMEFTLQGMTGIQAYDGATAWMFMPFMGQSAPEPMPEDMAKATAEEAEFDGPLMDYAAKGHTVQLEGKETVEGTETYKLRLTRNTGEMTVYYLDAEYYLPLKSESKRTLMGQEMTIVTSYGDYKEQGGLMMPHAISISGQGPGVQTLTIDNVELNIPIDDGEFKMPAPGGGMEDPTT